MATGAWPLRDWNASSEDTSTILEKNGPRSDHPDGSHFEFEDKLGAAERPRKSKLIWLIVAGAVVLLGIIGAIIGALVAKDVIKIGSGPGDNAESELAVAGDAAPSSTRTTASATSSTSASASASATGCTTSKSIPSDAKGTWVDVTAWTDMTDFNCTFTDELIGGLPMVGLNLTYDNSKRANPNVPPLSEPWGSYVARPARGVNLGGWLSLEPFITPSLFEAYPGSVDEYSLMEKMGLEEATKALDKHYATFVTEDTFRQIAAAGLDHIRIPFSYWAVTTYEGDPYVPQISWRYLLRGIEWARKYGLRIKLDLHGCPGSQNGWNHSGKQGKVNWISGDDGAVNAQRTLDIHKQLATFFAQDRYKNIIAFYGHVNEPAMSIPQEDLISWTQKAFDIVKTAGVNATQVYSESLRGLEGWNGKLQGYGDALNVDVHYYTIFDNALVGLKHADRVKFACQTYSEMIVKSMNNAGGGFGPTMVGEFSQADTDCTKYLNGVDTGARWVGTFGGNSDPKCPTGDSQCSCTQANASPSEWTAEYKLFLKTFAQAQMSAFEKSWGWFYWTWKTEPSASQWSYSAGIEGGYMPKVAYERDWDCSQPIPDFGSLPEFY